jgi:hypothetical protein
MNLDFLQLAVFGFFTGLGTTFGAEIARVAVEKLKTKLNDENEPQRR